MSEGFLFLKDPRGNFTATSLFNGVEGKFEPVNKTSWNGETKVYWLKFSVTNETDSDREWVFEFDTWAYVDFYYQEGTNLTLKKTGHLHPFKQRDYAVANANYIKIPVKKGDVIHCLVRLESAQLIDKLPQNLSFTSSPRYLVDEKESIASKVIFAFLGAFLIMFLYNLFIYFSTWLSTYAYYLLSLFFIAFNTAANSGHIFPMFGWVSGFPGWFYDLNLISSNLWAVAYILFVQSFLKVKDRYPVWNTVLTVLLYSFVATGILIFFAFDAGALLSQLLGLITILAVLWLGIRSVKDRYPSALYFLLGNTALLLGTMVIIFVLAGVLPKNDFTFNYVFPLGSTLEILLFSLALADMINVLRKENDTKQEKIIEQLRENQQLQSMVNRELEQKVQERTQALESSLVNLKNTQNQLIRKEKMASLGEVTAGIAHEIQNPLNFINNYSEVSQELLEELMEERQKKIGERNESLEEELLQDINGNLSRIGQHGKRADLIVKGMLQHSRPKSNDKELASLNALAGEYLRLAYHNILAKDPTFEVEISTDYDPNNTNVEMVAPDIGRVLLNLYNNAFYAVREKDRSGDASYQPQIHVSTRIVDDKIHLRVKDNGTGIAPDILGKIFQPFFTTKPTGMGIGLGLSMSYEIVNIEHGGELSVTTDHATYTEFLLCLPYQKDRAVPSA